MTVAVVGLRGAAKISLPTEEEFGTPQGMANVGKIGSDGLETSGGHLQQAVNGDEPETAESLTSAICCTSGRYRIVHRHRTNAKHDHTAIGPNSPRSMAKYTSYELLCTTVKT